MASPQPLEKQTRFEQIGAKSGLGDLLVFLIGRWFQTVWGESEGRVSDRWECGGRGAL